MSTENTPVDPISDDLDTFSADFFGQKEAQPEPASSEEVEAEVEDTTDATETPDDTHVDEDDTLDDDEAEEAPKPKKTRAQERIEELNRKYRETERQLRELQEKLERKEEAPAPVKESTKPSPADLNDDGSEKYPLGEFDPQYISDLTAHIFDEKQKELDAKASQTQAQREAAAAHAELQASWEQKLEPARERYPDFNERGQELIDSLGDLDPQYGEFLATTLMQMDHGTDVLYYLASHPDEATDIVNAGALRATIALGRLEAQFADKSKARPKVSQAPNPPPTNKGSAVAVAEIPDDTDDLDTFSKKFFSKK